MVAISSIPELYLPRKQPPSMRDREIYQAVVVDGLKQWDVAQAVGITQGRVAQIVGKVAAWIAETTGPQGGSNPAAAYATETEAKAGGGVETAPAEDAADSPASEASLTSEEQLRLAEFIAKERLENVYSLSLASFRKSQQDSQTTKVRQQGEKVVQECIVKTQCGQVGFLNQAMRAAMSLARLHGVDLSGKAARDEVAAEKAAALARQQAEAPAQAESSPVKTASSGADLDPAPDAQTLARTTNNRENPRQNGSHVLSQERLAGPALQPVEPRECQACPTAA